MKCVRFSHTDPQHLISESGGKVWQWDMSGHQIGTVYDGFHIAFSLDGTLFASCNGATITVQNSDSGIVMAKLHMAQSQFEKCCFSPNCKLIAGVTYKAVYVWDITDSNPHIIETIAGQGSGIACLVFSSSLVLGSFDGSVKF